MHHCMYCTKYSEKADTSSGLFKGYGQDGEFWNHNLQPHNVSEQHIACEKAWEKGYHPDHEVAEPRNGKTF